MLYELNAKQVVSKQCRLLGSRSRISGGRGAKKCILCDHLVDLKQSLQKYIKNLLTERDTNIKLLNSKKQQVPTTGTETKQLAKKLLNSLSKKNTASAERYANSGSDIIEQPSELCKHVEGLPVKEHKQGRQQNEADLSRGHLVQRLTYQGKRHSHSNEEQHDTKRVRSSTACSEQGNKVCKPKQKDCGDLVLVHETRDTVKLRELYPPTLEDACVEMRSEPQTSTVDQNQPNLFVADTHAVDHSSLHDREYYPDKGNSVVDQQMFIVPETQTMGNSPEPDIVEDANKSTLKDNQRLLITETQLVDHSPKIDLANGMGTNVHDDVVPQQTLFAPQIQIIDITSRSDKLDNADKNSRLINQQFLIQETHIMGCSSKPDHANEMKNNSHGNDQQKVAVPETHNLRSAFKSHLENEAVNDEQGDDDIKKRQHSVNQQVLHVQRPKTLDHLSSIIYISDDDNDCNVNPKYSSLEDVARDKNILEHTLKPGLHSSESSHFMMTKKQTQIQNQMLDIHIDMVVPNVLPRNTTSQLKCPTSFSSTRPSVSTEKTKESMCYKSFRKQTIKNEHVIDTVNTSRHTVDMSRGCNRGNVSSNLAQTTDLDTTLETSAETQLDSFDIVPKHVEHEFPHVSVVRKRNERNKLKGFSCKQCHEYYQQCGLSGEELKQKINDCSRHRERYCAPNTPKHFWSLGFRDTGEMNEKKSEFPVDSLEITGRMPRRRKPLEKRF